ncbi:hypothetical protein [Streptomyces lydicamycinicus]|uniref:hypothetical protein n=1 Tax=Streptomyces lydicamycinicus TaxID=1546107 RepID=UPI003C30DEB8
MPANQPRSQGGNYRLDRNRDRRIALVVHTIADTPAVFQGLWILLYLLEANQVSIFVELVNGLADALTWWSQDIFTMHTEGVGALLNYALPAVIYLLAGQGIAARIRRRSPCCVNPNL